MVQLNSSSMSDLHNCSINDFKKVVYPTIYLTVFILGVTGNSLSIYVFLQPYKKKTSVNVFMLNLAISDCLFVLTLPFRVHYYLYDSVWVFGDAGCRIMAYSLYVNMYCSIYFLTVLSIVRFVAIVHPFKHLKLTAIKYSRIICVVIWVFVLATASPLLAVGPSSNTTCLDLHPNSTDKMRGLNYFSLGLGFILPFCTIILCYVLVIKALLKTKLPQAKIRASHKKAMSTIIITLFMFLLCFLPYHILRTIYLEWGNGTKSNCSLHKGAVVTLGLAATNSCLDPVLYYFVGENFKERLRSICKKQGTQHQMDIP
uniref:Cysteinyl leukotriene receptor 2 n=1 Tax=Pelusios castaneus TaxID=367368 RepID=A0A8C8RKI3_9SAUR